MLRVAPLSGSKRVMPRPTMRAAPAISRAPLRFETKPDAPAARAARVEIRSPEDMRSIRVPGEALRSRAYSSPTDPVAAARSTTATCGAWRRASSIASSALCAATKRSTQCSAASSVLKPQWTRSCPSRSRTRRRLPSPAGSVRPRSMAGPGSVPPRAGLVVSTRGAHGGYRLARPAEEIAMDEVVLALEGSIAPMECFVNVPTERIFCSHEGDAGRACSTRLLWMRVQGGVIKALQGTTLAELVEFGARHEREPDTVTA